VALPQKGNYCISIKQVGPKSKKMLLIY